jgi:tape measure domain-containing protein
MAVDIDTIGISADTRGIQKGKRDLDEFGRSADTASKKADSFGNSVNSGVDKASDALSKFGRVIGVAYAAYGAFSRYVEVADTYTKITAQLKIATQSQEQYNIALDDVKRIAKTTQTDLEAVTKLYARLTGSLTELGIEQQKIAQISETVGLALKVSGASAGEASSVMLQLSQAFGSGVLRGDEFNSMAENSPTLMRALAQSLGVTTGALRDMASEGQITREVMLKAFGDQKLLDNLRTQAKEINTIGGAWQVLTTQISTAVGELDKALGVSNALAKSLLAVSGLLGKGGVTDTIGDFNSRLLDAARYKLGFETSQDKKNSARNRKNASSNNIFGGANPITYGGSVAPNFSSTIEVQDVNKIHQNQAELARKTRQYQEDNARKAEQAAERAKEKEKQLFQYKLRLQEELDAKSNKLADAAYKSAEKAEKAEYDRKVKQVNELQKLANKNFEEAQRATKELEDEAKKVSEDINRSLTDALLRGFESGKSFAKNFKDTLVNMFQTLVLRPVINFVLTQSGITGLVGSVGAMFSGNAVAGSSNGSGITGLFSSIKDAFGTGNGSIIGAIENLGSIISNGNGGLLDSIGGFMGQNSAAIADGLGYLGAGLQLAQGNIGGGLGTAVGTFFGGPVGGAIGSFLGSALGGVFGGGLPPRITESRTATSSGGAISFFNGADKGKRKINAASSLDALNETFIKNLNSIFDAYGIDNDITANSLLTKKKNTRARFNATVNGQFLGYEEINLGKKGTFQDAFNAMMEAALGGYTAKAIQASSLPDGVKKFFDNLTKKEDVADAINTLIGFKTSLLDLPVIFNAVRNAIDTTAYTTTIEQLKSQFQAVQTYTSLFYTEQENFATYTAQLTRQFSDLNIALPATRDAYRKLVDGITVVDEASRDQFSGLVALAPAMDAYFNRLQQQADGIEQVNQALADGLDKNLFSTYADYVSARASVANGLSANGFIGELSTKKAQGEADLANAVKSLVAQQARTDQILAEIADATRRTREINERWNGDGLPETRVI